MYGTPKTEGLGLCQGLQPRVVASSTECIPLIYTLYADTRAHEVHLFRSRPDSPAGSGADCGSCGDSGTCALLAAAILPTAASILLSRWSTSPRRRPSHARLTMTPSHALHKRGIAVIIGYVLALLNDTVFTQFPTYQNVRPVSRVSYYSDDPPLRVPILLSGPALKTMISD